MLHTFYQPYLQPDYDMIKVAIAGTGGLAQYIAHYLAAETSHQFILISRAVCRDTS